MNRYYCPFDGCLTEKGTSQKYFMSAKNGVIHCFEKHSTPNVQNSDEEYPITNDYVGMYLKQIVKYKSKRMEGRIKFRCTHEDCCNRLFKSGGTVIAHYAKTHMTEKQCQMFFATLSAEFSGAVESTASGDDDSVASEEEEDVPIKKSAKKAPAKVAKVTKASKAIAVDEEDENEVDFGSDLDGEIQSRAVSRSNSVASSIAEPMDLDDLDNAMGEVSKAPKKKVTTKSKK